jgi:NAD(P)-dependent dehydrogenase (short-subunit alcohol dehydrogenase family)
MSARSTKSAKKFDRNTTAMQVIQGHNLTGYDIIVTGGASGIGVETVRALAKAGARVTVTARDLERAKPVIEELKKSTGNDKIELEMMDLASLKSVHEFVERYLALNRPLHILINNAGENSFYF